MGWLKRMKARGEKLRDKAKEAYPRLTKKVLQKMPQTELNRLHTMISEEFKRRGK